MNTTKKRNYEIPCPKQTHSLISKTIIGLEIVTNALFLTYSQQDGFSAYKHLAVLKTWANFHCIHAQTTNSCNFMCIHWLFVLLMLCINQLSTIFTLCIHKIFKILFFVHTLPSFSSFFINNKTTSIWNMQLFFPLTGEADVLVEWRAEAGSTLEGQGEGGKDRGVGMAGEPTNLPIWQAGMCPPHRAQRCSQSSPYKGNAGFRHRS